MIKEIALQTLKATLAAIVFSLVFVLVFTLIIQLASLAVEVVKPVNQVFKILAIAAGILIFVRGEKGFLKGGITGLCSCLLTYILFSIIGGSFAVHWTFVFEILLSAAAGVVAGIIAVNIKSRKNG